MKPSQLKLLKRIVENPTTAKHRQIIELLTKKMTERLSEEKQRDIKSLASLGTTIYLSTKFRKGAGGGDVPKMKLEISMTPGKSTQLYRPVADESESEKFSLAIKLEIEKVFKLFDQKMEEIKTRYQLKLDDDSQIRTTSTVAAVPPPVAPVAKPAAPAAPKAAQAAPAEPAAPVAKQKPATPVAQPQSDPNADSEEDEESTK